MNFHRLTTSAFVVVASLALGTSAMAGESTLTLAPAYDDIVIQDEPDWQAIAWLLDEERASRLQDLLDELDFVVERLQTCSTPLAAHVTVRVAEARARAVGLWKIMGTPHDKSNDPAAIFAEMAPVVAFVDEFVGLTGVEDSHAVQSQWNYASRDFADLRVRFGDS
jgi:hypothetical protein